jgi:membrane protein implicated in regulation of membrane protease activity
MTMGIGVFLFVVGAILAFAVHATVSGFSLMTAGDILMVAGVVVFAISLILTLSRRRSVSTARTGVDASGAQVTQRETVSGGPNDSVI